MSFPSNSDGWLGTTSSFKIYFRADHHATSVVGLKPSAGLLPQANHSALIQRASESKDKQRRNSDKIYFQANHHARKLKDPQISGSF